VFDDIDDIVGGQEVTKEQPFFASKHSSTSSKVFNDLFTPEPLFTGISSISSGLGG
jgi:hypothetical protein